MISNPKFTWLVVLAFNIVVLCTHVTASALEKANDLCEITIGSASGLIYLPEYEPYFGSPPSPDQWAIDAVTAKLYCRLSERYLRSNRLINVEERFEQAKKTAFGLTVDGEQIIYLQFEPTASDSDHGDVWPIWGLVYRKGSELAIGPFLSGGVVGLRWYREDDVDRDGFGLGVRGESLSD